MLRDSPGRSSHINNHGEPEITDVIAKKKQDKKLVQIWLSALKNVVDLTVDQIIPNFYLAVALFRYILAFCSWKTERPEIRRFAFQYQGSQMSGNLPGNLKMPMRKTKSSLYPSSCPTKKFPLQPDFWKG